MLVTTVFTSLLVNPKSITAKPGASGGSKICAAWKVAKVLHFVVQTDKVTTDSSTDWGKQPQPLKSCLIWNVVQPLYTLGNSRREWGRMPALDIQDAGE